MRTVVDDLADDVRGSLSGSTYAPATWLSPKPKTKERADFGWAAVLAGDENDVLEPGHPDLPLIADRDGAAVALPLRGVRVGSRESVQVQPP
jgi:hypothetical protein